MLHHFPGAVRSRHIALLCLVLGAAILAACTQGAARKPIGTPREQRLTVIVKRYEFIPATLTVRKGRKVVIRFRSGDVAYGVRIPELGLAVRVPARGDAKLTFTPERAGTFAIRCADPGPQPGCAQMRAVLQVRD